MKNLTRILALVLVFTMMVSSAAFAAKFTDVAEDSTYAEAVEVLSALGIINGYEDGTFKPDAVITRAEVVAIVNRLQGLSDAAKAAAGTSMYTDVATSDWFAGDVNLASQMGIVSGDGNGLFRPNDQVKYEEAVKMMVAALGYNQNYVLKQGGWPTGYLIIATDKGVTKGLSATAGTPAPRGVVAKLAYQSLTAPMMVLASYDDEGKATYASDATKTLLGTKLGFAKLIGHVIRNEVTALDGTLPGKPGTIIFQTENAERVKSVSEENAYGYKCFVGNEDVVAYSKNLNASQEAISLTTKEILVGETDVADTIALATEVYVGLNEENKAEVLTYIVDDSKNSTVEIANVANVQKDQATETALTGKTLKYPTNLDFDADGVAFSGTVELSVYDEDTDNTNTEYVLENPILIFNGAYVTIATDYATSLGTNLGSYLYPAAGSMKLLDNDGDGKYNIVYVDTYETKVVNSVVASGKKINFKVGTALNLEDHIDGKEGYSYSITLDGEKIAVSDLKEYDVLTVKSTPNGKKVDIVVSRNTVEGSLEGRDQVGTSVSRKDLYTVAGTDYKVANMVKYPSIKLGAEGTFYLNSFGDIAYFEGSSALTGNLAFIRRAGSYPSNWDASKTEYEIELINKDGSIGVYNIAENVSVKLDDKDAYITGTTVTAYAAGATVAKQTKDAVGGVIASLAPSTPVEANVAARVITYKANSANEIVSITFAAAGVGEGLKYSSLATQEYDADVAALGQVGITENTTVFYVPHPQTGIAHTANYTYEDYEVATSAFLKNDTKYNYAYLDRDDANNVSVLVITYADTKISDGTNLAVILASRQVKDEEGNDVIEIDVVQGGEEATLRVDADVNDTWNSLTVLSRGAYLDYAVNAEGNIDKATVVTMAAVEDKAKGLAAAYPTFKADTVTQKSYYIGGYVVDTAGSAVVLNTTFKGATTPNDADYVGLTSGNRIAVPADANVYYVDTTKTRPIAEIVGTGDITACMSYQQGGVVKAEEDANTFVVMKYNENKIVDVIIYYGFDL